MVVDRGRSLVPVLRVPGLDHLAKEMQGRLRPLEYLFVAQSQFSPSCREPLERLVPERSLRFYRQPLGELSRRARLCLAGSPPSQVLPAPRSRRPEGVLQALRVHGLLSHRK